MRVFGHLPACNGLAHWQNVCVCVGGGLGARWAFAARGRRPGQNPSTALSDFAFRGQGAMRDKIYGLICGGMSPTRVVLNHCEGAEARGASAKSMRSVRASISCFLAIRALTQWLLGWRFLSLRHAMWMRVALAVCHSFCTQGVSPRVMRSLWPSWQAKVKQSVKQNFGASAQLQMGVISGFKL
jgi:hypothetical protein